MEQYIKKSALITEIEKIRKNQRLNDRHDQGVLDGLHAIEKFIDTLEVKEVNKKSETACRSKIIKVKCISPFDETWEKGKVYICEKWHHGDLNMDFWDVYYDYDNNPKYVQFSSIEMLEKEFAILRNDTLEVKEIGVDLGDPKGDKSAKYIIDTKTLEVKEVDFKEECKNEWKNTGGFGSTWDPDSPDYCPD